MRLVIWLPPLVGRRAIFLFSSLLSSSRLQAVVAVVLFLQGLVH